MSRGRGTGVVDRQLQVCIDLLAVVVYDDVDARTHRQVLRLDVSQRPAAAEAAGYAVQKFPDLTRE